MGEVHAIMNLDRYASYIRRRAAASISEDQQDDLNEYITIPQTRGMILEHSIGTDEEGRQLLDESSHSALFEAVRTRIYNCGLSKLASKNLLECAWDSDTEEMVFWARAESD